MLPGLAREKAVAELRQTGITPSRGGLGYRKRRVQPFFHFAGIEVSGLLERRMGSPQRNQLLRLRLPYPARPIEHLPPFAKLRLGVSRLRTDHDVGLPSYERGESGHRGKGAVPPHLLEIVGRRLEELRSDEVPHHLVDQCRLVGDHLDSKARTTVERVLLQHTLTKSVNGGDRGLVEAIDGGEESAPCGTVGALPRQEVVPVLRRRGISVEPRYRFLESAPHPLPELRRCGVGVGHNHDLIGTKAGLDQKPEVQHLDRVGLSGAGTGPDKGHARELVLEGSQGSHSRLVSAAARNRPYTVVATVAARSAAGAELEKGESSPYN